MSKRSNAYHQESFQDISFQVNTNKKQKKNSSEFVSSSSISRKEHTFPSTQRKALSYGNSNGVLMDQTTTPMKSDISRNKQVFFNGNQQVSQHSKHRQILIRLDETQKRLIQSQKKYGELFRKYEAACELIKRLSEQKQVGGRSYEMMVAALRREVQELRLQLQSKEHQISKMLFQTNTTANNPQSLSFQLLQQRLTQVHRQKLAVITSYQSKLSELSQGHQQQFRLMEMQWGRKLQQEMARGREGRMKLEEMELQLRRERMGRYEEVEMLKEENAVLINQLQQLTHINQLQLQTQIAFTRRQSQRTKPLQPYQLSQQHSLHQLSSQLQCIKHQITSLNTQMQHKQELLQMAVNEKDRLFQQVLTLQQTTKRQGIQLLEHNKQFKSHIEGLLQRVAQMQQQKQLIQRQLLAERLQTFKLKQQLQETTSTLKKQYQLSLENLNKQLSMKIQQTNTLKSIETKQKQQLYIQLKQLEKKYELLTSEMLTVDDMMSIATKVHKRHSRFVKK